MNWILNRIYVLLLLIRFHSQQPFSELVHSEEQKIADADALNKQRIHQISESTKLKEVLISTPVEQHNDLIEEWIANNRSYDIGKGVSKPTTAQSQSAQGLFVQQTISNARISSAQRMESEARQNAASLEKLAIESLDRDGAIAAWGGILSGSQMDVRLKIIDRGIENQQKLLKRESDNAISAEVLTNTDAMSLENNAEAIDEQVKLLDAGEGLFAGLSDVKKQAVRNSMVEQMNGVLFRRSKAFSDVLDDAVKNGMLNDETLSDMKDAGLLTDSQEIEMRKIFSSRSRTKQLSEEFSEQKNGITYKTMDKELDETYLLSFAEGDNTKIQESYIRKFVDRIDRDPGLGIIAKNKLKAKLALAASQAIIESDNAVGTQLGESWEDLPDERKQVLSRYAQEVSKIMLESNVAQLSLTKNGDQTEYPSFADMLIEDLRHLADEFNRGVDPTKTDIPQRMRLYKVGSQQLRVRDYLLTPEAERNTE